MGNCVTPKNKGAPPTSTKKNGQPISTKKAVQEALLEQKGALRQAASKPRALVQTAAEPPQKQKAKPTTQPKKKAAEIPQKSIQKTTGGMKNATNAKNQQTLSQKQPVAAAQKVSSPQPLTQQAPTEKVNPVIEVSEAVTVKLGGPEVESDGPIPSTAPDENDHISDKYMEIQSVQSNSEAAPSQQDRKSGQTLQQVVEEQDLVVPQRIESIYATPPMSDCDHSHSSPARLDRYSSLQKPLDQKPSVQEEPAQNPSVQEEEPGQNEISEQAAERPSEKGSEEKVLSVKHQQPTETPVKEVSEMPFDKASMLEQAAYVNDRKSMVRDTVEETVYIRVVDDSSYREPDQSNYIGPGVIPINETAEQPSEMMVSFRPGGETVQPDLILQSEAYVCRNMNNSQAASQLELLLQDVLLSFIEESKDTVNVAALAAMSRSTIDVLDMMGQEAIKTLLCGLIPVLKVDDSGKFLLGTKLCTFQVKQDQLVVQTGGGVTDLKKWLKKHSTIECVKFSKLMAECSNDSYRVMHTLLDKNMKQLHKSEVNQLCAQIDQSTYGIVVVTVDALKKKSSADSNVPNSARSNFSAQKSGGKAALKGQMLH